jgi:hypothetical protein
MMEENHLDRRSPTEEEEELSQKKQAEGLHRGTVEEETSKRNR